MNRLPFEDFVMILTFSIDIEIRHRNLQVFLPIPGDNIGAEFAHQRLQNNICTMSQVCIAIHCGVTKVVLIVALLAKFVQAMQSMLTVELNNIVIWTHS